MDELRAGDVPPLSPARRCATQAPEASAAPRAHLGHQLRTGAARRVTCSAREVRSVAFQQCSVEISFIIYADQLRAIGISKEAASAGCCLLRSLVATRHPPCFDLLLM